jgi:hypothetical protein
MLTIDGIRRNHTTSVPPTAVAKKSAYMWLNVVDWAAQTDWILKASDWSRSFLKVTEWLMVFESDWVIDGLNTHKTIITEGDKHTRTHTQTYKSHTKKQAA